MFRYSIFLPALAAASLSAAPAHADHTCDPVSDPGWRVLPDHEFVDQKDSAPIRDGDTWYVERTTRVLPYCNYFDEIGNYSLRSYSLSLRASTARVAICRGNVAIAPYAGPCPPK
jgi:hypothetical protein